RTRGGTDAGTGGRGDGRQGPDGRTWGGRPRPSVPSPVSGRVPASRPERHPPDTRPERHPPDTRPERRPSASRPERHPPDTRRAPACQDRAGRPSPRPDPDRRTLGRPAQRQDGVVAAEAEGVAEDEVAVVGE